MWLTCLGRGHRMDAGGLSEADADEGRTTLLTAARVVEDSSSSSLRLISFGEKGTSTVDGDRRCWCRRTGWIVSVEDAQRIGT